ncbi:anti-sigma factor family protein [Pseudomonas sp. NPDC090203]|uniref:anti-sigma factor family protein n=1 Tax=Pseudomonas sp. NPDC090203 TaxID=3364477 RepID=UPI00382F5936
MTDLTCATCRVSLHGYLDDELDAAAAAEIVTHLQGCAECRQQYDQARLLTDSVKRHAPYYAAPDLLVRSVFAPPPAQRVSWLARAKGWLAPAFSAAALALALVLYIATPTGEQPWMEEAVSSHVRSLMAGHLNDVASSDRHTVKPWFTGKLDFSPPVHDFAEQGYPLLGGRLDYLQHQTAAALSYGRAKHVINLFIVPTTEADTPRQDRSLRGYNIVAWQQNHMRFIAVSDVERGELEAFSALVEKGL